MATKKTTDKEATQEVDLSQIMEQVKSVPFEQRKTLIKALNDGHSKDLDKASYGAEADGSGYVLPEA